MASLNLKLKVLDFVKSGGDRGTRTPDLRVANAALSQLSYIPTKTETPPGGSAAFTIGTREG